MIADINPRQDAGLGQVMEIAKYCHAVNAIGTQSPGHVRMADRPPLFQQNPQNREPRQSGSKLRLTEKLAGNSDTGVGSCLFAGVIVRRAGILGSAAPMHAGECSFAHHSDDPIPL
jgi:hypothetical protein